MFNYQCRVTRFQQLSNEKAYTKPGLQLKPEIQQSLGIAHFEKYDQKLWFSSDLTSKFSHALALSSMADMVL